ncbi:hypothetical protein GCM10022222_09350 [Amycolatopsis ultiminotia]|uniref:NIPSNAP protein n=1 Tax=Amycolatopsis ultiminotia TaxID=543629 RepID=A0ABP6V8T0_9PSEU
MPTVQLRRYQVKSDELEGFVNRWHLVLPVRRQYGFEVLFAFVDRSTNQFVWAVSHEGESDEFDAAEKLLMESPEGAAIRADYQAADHSGRLPVELLDEMFIAKVDVLHQIWGD